MSASCKCIYVCLSQRVLILDDAIDQITIHLDGVKSHRFSSESSPTPYLAAVKVAAQ